MNNDAPAPQSPALALIQNAVDQKVAPETLEKLLAVKKDWEADEARKSYYSALSEFQSDAPIVEKGDDANGKPYARMDRIWRTIRPLLSKVGITVSWQVSELRQNEVLGLHIHLEGQMAHRSGHVVPLRADMAVPDAITSSSGKVVQNRAQVVGSAITYCERYATCSALGLVTGEDDDGNGGVRNTLDAGQQKQIKEWVKTWQGTPGWTQEREGVFWRFVSAGAPLLKDGTADLGKVTSDRFLDIAELLKRSMKGGVKS